jgi:hypothetical protein
MGEIESQSGVPTALMQRYLASLPEKEAQLRALWQAFLADPGSEQLSELRSLLHRYAGSTSMYGLESLGRDLRTPLRAADAILDSNDESARKTLIDGMSAVFERWSAVSRDAESQINQGLDTD